MKKLSVFSLLAICALIITGCSKKDNSNAEKKLKIGIIQYVEHSALDASCKGFIDGLAEYGYVDGEKIIIDYHNAQNEQANCVTIAEKLINDRSDLIFAIATPAAQAVANMTKKIPIVVSAVTDPKTALLVKDNLKPDTNVTGTSDLNPCEAQISLLKKIVPSAKTVGMLYSSNEQNSIFQIELAKKSAEKLGLKCIEATVSNTNEIQQVTQNLCGKVDAIYSPTDNMVASAIATVAQVALENKIPTIAGEANMVYGGALATYGINYYELGKLSAKMAVSILTNESRPQDMPIQYLEKFDLTVNEKTAASLGIEIPSDL